MYAHRDNKIKAILKIVFMFPILLAITPFVFLICFIFNPNILEAIIESFFSASHECYNIFLQLCNYIRVNIFDKEDWY